MKKVVSLILCTILLLTSFTEVFATTLNVNVNGEVKKVDTSEDKFFNVEFTGPNYQPEAEQVYTMLMGSNIEMWRYSGDKDKSQAGSQNWGTPWGYKTDVWIQELMDGLHSPLTTLNQVVPEGVMTYLKSGGSWDDIKITFQCINEDGNEIKPANIFENGAVDAWLKWGQEIQLQFKPIFKTDETQYIFEGNKVKLNRAIYPYSYTAFSMWAKDGSNRQYGATRVWDKVHEEPGAKYEGYDPLEYKDIQNNKGHIKSGLNLKNIQHPGKTETGHNSTAGISTDIAKIGSGTFNSGGATGIGFSFPIKITFEIKPKANTNLLTEIGMVNLQDIDGTLSNIQMYSERNEFIENLNRVGVARIKDRLTSDNSFKNTLKGLVIGEDKVTDNTVNKVLDNYIDKMSKTQGLSNELIYKYATSLGDLSSFTDAELEVLNAPGMTTFLDFCIGSCVYDLYSSLINNYLIEDITSSKDMKEVTFANKQVIMNKADGTPGNNSLILSGKMSKFKDTTKNFKALYSLPIVTYLYNKQEITQDTIRKYAMLNTKEIAEQLSDMSNTNLYYFVEDNNILSGVEVDGKRGYYEFIHKGYSDMLMKMSSTLGEQTIYDVNKNVVKLSDTGITDNFGGYYKIKETDALTVKNNDIISGLGFALSTYTNYDGMTFQNGTDETKLIYDGVYSYTPMISDFGCDVKMDIVKVNADSTTEFMVNDMFIGTANRFEKFDNFNSYITANGSYLYSSGGENYKPVVVAYSEKSDAEVHSIVADFINNNKTVISGVYEVNGVVMAVGDSGIDKTSIYPTAEQLKNQSDINISVFVRELEDTLMSVTYVDENDNFLETRVGIAPIENNKTWACLSGELTDAFDFVCAYVSVEKPVQGLNEKTTWSMISACEPYDGQWLTAPGFVNIDISKEQVVYVKGKRKASEPAVTGDFVIGQQRISKAFNTINVYKPGLRTFSSVNTTSHKRKYYCGGRYCRGHWEYCRINTTSRDTYNIIWNITSDATDKIQVGSYGTRLFSNSTGKKFLSLRNGTNDRVNADMRFVLWRGYDKPVASSYADSGNNNDVWNKFGIGSGNKYNSSGTNGNYTKNIKVTYKQDGSSDSSVTFNCSFGKTHAGTVTGETKTANTTLAVNTYSGWKGSQTASSVGTTNNTINGIGMTTMFKGTVKQNTIRFYPYVDMKYEDMDGNIKSLNVLSKYESNITPISTIEYGYKKGSDDSLNITSSMWSTHQRAVNAKGRNNVLVGGATYKLNNNTENKLPVVGITTYSWYVPGDAEGAVYSGVSGNTQAEALNRHTNAVASLKSSVTGKEINQKISVGGNTYTPKKGQSAPWLNNVPFDTENKYWFNGIPVNTQIIEGSEVTNADYYRIYSDTKGNVYLVHGSNLDYTFNKWNTNEYIIGQLNAEWRDINDKTGLVSCYLASIIRNAGNDKEFVSDGTWYNEAFPGLCVVKQSTTFKVGLNNQIKNKDNVVNMRYIAGGTTSKADVYKNFNLTWFTTENGGLTVNYGGQTLNSGAINLNFRTRNWWIPNATVYDND